MGRDARISPRSGSINRSNQSIKMKHYTDTTHYYEPIDNLLIEIESNGRMWITHHRDRRDLSDFYFNKPEDALILVGIADAIKLHYNTIIHPTLTQPSDEQ